MTSISSVIINTFITATMASVAVATVTTIAVIVQPVFITVTAVTPVTSIVAGSDVQILLHFGSHRSYDKSKNQQNL